MLIDETTDRLLDDDGGDEFEYIWHLLPTLSDLAATSSAHLSLTSKEFQHKTQKLSNNNFLPVYTNASEF